MKYLTFLPFTCLFLFAACGSDDDAFAENIEEIETYLADNNINAQSTDSGLYYIIDEEGTGEFLAPNDLITVDYKGYFTDGTVFDETILYPATFVLNGLIPGWLEGLQLFRPGGTGRLFIPAKLGYGSNPPSGIPKNAVLIFEITVIDDLKAYEENRILEYTTENELTTETTASGLQYIIEVEGEGNNPNSGSEVTVNYTGYFLDGEVFDEGNPSTFTLSNVIPGWQEGIPFFKKGGSGKLFVPSHLAYGINPPQGFPLNATLIYDVELIDFTD